MSGAHRIVDARVRVPSPSRFEPAEAATVYADYDEVLALGDGWNATFAELDQSMNDAGIDHAIVHAEFEAGDLADELNDGVAALVASDPGRFSGFGTVTLCPMRISRAVRQVQRAADDGLIGINIQPSFFDLTIDERVLYPVYAKAEELGLVVGVHTGINYSRAHPMQGERPELLDQVACDFRDLTLIACHGAWPWVAEMVAVARRHPNVLIDFGGLSPKYVGVARSGWDVMRHFMDNVLRDQVLFATDWPVFPQARAIEEWRAIGLRDETLARLFGGNALALLRAPETIAR